MTSRTVAVICLSVCVAARVAAQASGAQSDPISGKWGIDGTTYLDLRLGESGTVSGSVMAGRPDNMATIERGTFDAATRSFKVEGSANHPDSGAPVRFVVEGRLDRDSLLVIAAIGDFRGNVTLGKLSSQSQPNEIAEALRFGFNEVNGWLMKSAELVPADKYDYKPVESVRTFGQLVAHVADSYIWYCTRASGSEVEWSDATEKGSTDKAAVTRKLAEALQVCAAAYGRSGARTNILMANIAHTNLHYGNIITYLRMLGLTPPSS